MKTLAMSAFVLLALFGAVYLYIADSLAPLVGALS